MDRGVVIVGAGIPALALAIVLQERGIGTVLVDSRRAADRFPRGLTLQPNGLEALSRLGLLEKALQTGARADVFEIRSWSGELLLEADYQLLDHPQNYLLTVDSSELELILRRKAEQVGAQIAWRSSFRNLLYANGKLTGVRVESEGTPQEIHTRVVVGADGAQSKVRSAAGLDAEVRKYPDSFIVGLVGPVADLQGRAREYQAPGKLLGVMPKGPEASYIFHSVAERSFEEVKAAGLGEFKAEINRVAPETVESMREVQNWTSLAYVTPNRVRANLWVADGVCLLGDAAHSFHPHVGQGLNLSLQDALVLAEVVENALKTADISSRRLMEYESRRRMFSQVISRQADYSAQWALSSNWLIKRLNRRALRRLQRDRQLLREALEITAGVFRKKPSLLKLARIGGILP